MKYILKKIYSLIPLKSKLYNIVKKIWIPNRFYKHLYFNELFTIKVNDNKKFKIYGGNGIENEIYWKGLTENNQKESIRIWMELCKYSDCIFDIGANTGFYTLIAKSINPSSRIYAFEPQSSFFRILKKNININNYDIKLYNMVVSNSDDNISFINHSKSNNFFFTKSVKLDTFIEKNHITKIDLLKIDLEGLEYLILEGFLKHISHFRPTFLIKILDDNVSKLIYESINRYDYLYFSIDERGTIKKMKNIELNISVSYHYLLCNSEIAIKLGLL